MTGINFLIIISLIFSFFILSDEKNRKKVIVLQGVLLYLVGFLFAEIIFNEKFYNFYIENAIIVLGIYVVIIFLLAVKRYSEIERFSTYTGLIGKIDFVGKLVSVFFLGVFSKLTVFSSKLGLEICDLVILIFTSIFLLNFKGTLKHFISISGMVSWIWNKLKEMFNNTKSKIENSCEIKIYQSRKPQEKLIDEFIEDKYSKRLLIDGKWGIGKTYFVTQITNKMKNNNKIYRIDLDILIFNDREKLAAELMNQLRKIFKDENIFSTNLSDLGIFLDSSNLGLKKWISKQFSLSNSFVEAKENLKNDIKLVKRKIVIVCDNLERIMCNDDYKEWKELVGFIHDLSDLGENVKLLVLADYEKLRSVDDKTSNNHSEYFEKFYDYYVKLSGVKYYEIIDDYIVEHKGRITDSDVQKLNEVIYEISQNFIEKLNPIKNNEKQIRKDIADKTWKLNFSKRKANNSESDKEKDKLKKEINELEDDLLKSEEENKEQEIIITCFSHKVENPRIVEKILYEINKIDNQLEIEKQYTIRVKLLKIIYPKYYNKIISDGYIDFKIKNHYSEEFKIFFKGNNMDKDKSDEIYEHLFSNQCRKINKEIKFIGEYNISDKIKEIYFNYIYSEVTKDDLSRIIKEYEKVIEFISNYDREEFLEMIDNKYLWRLFNKLYKSDPSKKLIDIIMNKETNFRFTKNHQEKVIDKIMSSFYKDIEFLENNYEERRFDFNNIFGLLAAFKVNKKLVKKLSLPKEIIEEGILSILDYNYFIDKILLNTKTDEETIKKELDNIPKYILEEITNINDKTRKKLRENLDKLWTIIKALIIDKENTGYKENFLEKANSYTYLRTISYENKLKILEGVEDKFKSSSNLYELEEIKKKTVISILVDENLEFKDLKRNINYLKFIDNKDRIKKIQDKFKNNILSIKFYEELEFSQLEYLERDSTLTSELKQAIDDEINRRESTTD